MSVSFARRATARLVIAGLLAGSAVSVGAVSTAAPAAAQTAAPAPSATGRLVVVSSTSYATGSTRVFLGEVRNDWNKVVEPSAVPLQLLDASGNVLQSTQVFPARSYLAPGETTTFARSLTPPPGYASFRTGALTTEIGSRVPNHAFEVTVTSSSASGISGTVKNLNTATAAAPSVELVLRDAAGAVYDVDRAFPKGTGTDGALAPGETASFTAQRFSSDPFRGDGSVTGLAESFSARSPYPTQIGVKVPAKVTAGQAGRVVLTVLGAGTDGAVPPGVKVQLFGREAGQSAFKLLRSATTTGSPTLTFDLKPQRDIRWQGRVPAAPNAVASTSSPALTQVAFGVTSTGSTSGTGGTLSGGVRPASPGALVYLQQQVGGVWRNVASQRLTSSSTYAFRVVKPVGRYTYRVFKPAVTGNQAGYGPVMVYTVS